MRKYYSTEWDWRRNVIQFAFKGGLTKFSLPEMKLEPTQSYPSGFTLLKISKVQYSGQVMCAAADILLEV